MTKEELAEQKAAATDRLTQHRRPPTLVKQEGEEEQREVIKMLSSERTAEMAPMAESKPEEKRVPQVAPTSEPVPEKEEPLTALRLRCPQPRKPLAFPLQTAMCSPSEATGLFATVSEIRRKPEGHPAIRAGLSAIGMEVKGSAHGSL